MNITIAGYGFVGSAHHELLKDEYNIQIVDPKFNNDRIAQDIDGVIICVATPQHTDGTCNMQHVFEVMNDVPATAPVLIKSTISLEGWQELVKRYPEHQITFSPEYLRAASAVDDLKNTQTVDLSTSGKYYFWHIVFESVIFNFSSRLGEPEELILAKYFRNSFLATKVAFFNQVYDLCAATSIDYRSVAQHIGNDPRIGNSHTAVTEERGFGGHCFPKDINAITKTARRVGTELSIIEEANNYNNRLRNGDDKN